MYSGGKTDSVGRLDSRCPCPVTCMVVLINYKSSSTFSRDLSRTILRHCVQPNSTPILGRALPPFLSRNSILDLEAITSAVMNEKLPLFAVNYRTLQELCDLSFGRYPSGAENQLTVTVLASDIDGRESISAIL